MYSKKSRRYELLKKQYNSYLKQFTDECSKQIELWDHSKIDSLMSIIGNYQLKMNILLLKERSRNSKLAKKEIN